ncbi:hypothetical protein VN21_06810 [Paraclostridium benzoelyticum]|uniref:Uncharacterized protein n=2 Tax=Paraclostridium benzoelyticum TaxID=1629550 RepID=A0A0M3DHF4_9FIRM|nr:hypothetical protein VN21_06810 [Paraclostridium benzoelyticum]OXX84954.1 hypothetical protein AVM15_01330 [Paraclostridium benzoelyticum]
MLIKRLGEVYKEKLDIKLYQAGKDFTYLKKYGIITKGTMIINQRKKYDRLSKDVIEKAIIEAINN